VKLLGIEKPLALAPMGSASGGALAAAVSGAGGLGLIGAEGVLVGTRFLASEESLIAPQAKRRLVAAKGDVTLRTTVFDVVRSLDWPARFPGRALRNKFSDAWHGRERELKENLAREKDRYVAAAEQRDFDTAVIFAGEAVNLIDSVLPAREIVKRICG
jgi:nitronate monooxygenase